MNFSLFFDQVEKHFRYLIDDYGFSVVKKKQYDSFDNAKIILQSIDCRIEVFRERGFVEVYAGPLSSPKERYDLATLIAFLTKKEAKQFDYEIPIPEYDYDARIEWQVKKLAGILQMYCSQICRLFHKEVLDENRKELMNLINLQFEEWVNTVRKSVP